METNKLPGYLYILREITVPASRITWLIVQHSDTYTEKIQNEKFCRETDDISYRPPPTIVRMYPGGPLPIGPYGPGVIADGIPACIGPKAIFTFCVC